MARKKRTTLTPLQREAIQLNIEGKTWKEITEILEVSRTAVWEWRKSPFFQAELTLTQEMVLNETASRFSHYVSMGYNVLAIMAKNENDKYDHKIQFEASCKLIEYPLMAIEKLKIIEHNRRELNLEDASIREETDNGN